jgi:ribosomal protein S1
MSSDPSLTVAESVDQAPTLSPATEADDVSTEAVAASESARRVELRPSGTEDFKAVGSVDSSTMDRDLDVEAEREARPLREHSSAHMHRSVDVPAAEDLEASLEAEINAALSSGAATATGIAGATATAIAEMPAEESLHTGKRLKGRVALVHGENIFLDLGYRSQGLLPARQFEGREIPQPGAEVDVIVTRVSPDEGLIHVSLPTGKQRLSGNWDGVQKGQIVDCMVTKTNKGGLEVTVGTLRGFMPSGQIDLRFVENLEQFVNQKLRVKITEANKHKRNLIVSRRALLVEERREAEEKILGTLEVGQTVGGTIATIKDYGAFVDLGGVDGFLHIGQISWLHLKHPSEVLQEGQPVQVKVVTISEDKKKIGLSLKQLVQNPWEQAAGKYFQGQTVSGTVTRTTDFGAFVELEPGVEGMIHISELDYKRVFRVTDVVSVGQQLELQVRDVDPAKHRIGLSLKALKAKPEEPKPEAADDEPAAPPPKRKTTLKGGREANPSRGGLFGNPNDFR